MLEIAYYITNRRKIMLKENEKKNNEKVEIKKSEDNKELSIDEVSEVNGGWGNRPVEVSDSGAGKKPSFI